MEGRVGLMRELNGTSLLKPQLLLRLSDYIIEPLE
jgi:hypothetical protein